MTDDVEHVEHVDFRTVWMILGRLPGGDEGPVMLEGYGQAYTFAEASVPKMVRAVRSLLADVDPDERPATRLVRFEYASEEPIEAEPASDWRGRGGYL